MKSNPITLALVAAACLCALATALLSLMHVLSARQMGRAQAEVNAVNRYHMIAQALANDASEYGKRNPAIHEVLKSIGAARPGAGSTAVVPAAAPRTPGK
jgi:hypothetical protein